MIIFGINVIEDISRARVYQIPKPSEKWREETVKLGQPPAHFDKVKTAARGTGSVPGSVATHVET